VFCSGQRKRSCSWIFHYKNDSVPHQPLTMKLEGVDLNPVILVWVKNYLAKRSSYVVANGTSFQPSAVVSGISQGSAWVLVIFYINDQMEQELMAGSVLHVHADDIQISSTDCTIHSTHDFLSLQSTITAWSYANFLSNLTLNSNKCKFMVLFRWWSPSYPVIQ